jgi:hypothetical protein
MERERQAEEAARVAKDAAAQAEKLAQGEAPQG